MYVCMYVCMYVYVRTSGVARVCAFVHVSMYVRKYDIRTYTHMRTGFMCLSTLACIGPTMRATHVYIHTYDVPAHCATFGTTPSLLGRDESARMYVCTYVLLGFTCLACVGLAMRATQDYIRTNDVAAHCATLARRHHYSCTMTRSAQNC